MLTKFFKRFNLGSAKHAAQAIIHLTPATIRLVILPANKDLSALVFDSISY